MQAGRPARFDYARQAAHTAALPSALLVSFDRYGHGRKDIPAFLPLESSWLIRRRLYHGLSDGSRAWQAGSPREARREGSFPARTGIREEIG